MGSMEEEIKSLIKVCLSIFASLCYTYFIASKIPKGKLRLLSLLPIFYLFTTLPFSLSTALPAGVFAMFITWVGSFKLLLFSFGHGPLSSDPPLNSLILFIFTACLPIKTSQQLFPNLERTPKLPLNLPTKILLFGILVALTDYKKYLHPRILLGQYCCMLYLFVDVLVGVANATMRAVLGIELESPSNEPYLSTSLQDFWGRRWNLMITNTLRQTVHKPVRSAAETFLGTAWAPLPAVLATFLVSGLMHELIYFYMTRATPTWEVTWFFVLHGVCLVVEFGVKKALGGRWRLHWVVSTPLTIVFVVATATWLFFPPLVRNGVDTRAIEECKELVEFVKQKLKWDQFSWPIISLGH
ncbi:probable long-chain-alcohol O-fatty-acyltransferase 5 [Pyrus x bretschneideri]|uniref:probable long-chain-alcohol O-fatty-acyltransferase 5 n=1 Tax=Pyrus x bretschneideri TaxID=225117 RepID=UPI00202E256B|nr:probable long-chain-alcohol O-fatty-acyltransferase 5 [Pyrus x bretschneideri]